MSSTSKTVYKKELVLEEFHLKHTPMHISMFEVDLLKNFIYSMNGNGINKTMFLSMF